MKRLLLLVLVCSTMAAAQVRFDQRLGVTVPGDILLLDESGRPVQLDSFLHQGPVVLVLAYYACPMLCTQVLNGLGSCLADLTQAPHPDFQVVVVSIDPRDTSAQARQKLALYRRRCPVAWHFLVSPQSQQVEKLATAVGFHYTYDSRSGQYAHPAGLVVLDPQGRISSYLMGVRYEPPQLGQALTRAAAQKVGSPVDRLLMICFAYNPDASPRGALVLGLMRGLGILATLALATLILRALRRERRT